MTHYIQLLEKESTKDIKTLKKIQQYCTYIISYFVMRIIHNSQFYTDSYKSKNI